MTALWVLRRPWTPLLVVLLLIGGCGVARSPSLLPASTAAPAVAPTPRADGLAHEEAATLATLELVDQHPLYVMRFVGEYGGRVTQYESGEMFWTAGRNVPTGQGELPAWGCSLFAALGDPENRQYGRNFDWNYSPALLLFTDPSDGYASVSMVDLAYLQFGDAGWTELADLPLAERRPLLDTPYMPFDGMNERGLVVGMAAVPASVPPREEGRGEIDSLRIIREALDHAGTVEDALALMSRYNILWGGGPALHYLIADASGQAALIEYQGGEMIVLESTQRWHLATNFLVSSAGELTEGRCWRYDRLQAALLGAGGCFSPQAAMDLLADVSVEGTQWSAVYEMNRGLVHVVMARKYDRPHQFALDITVR